MKELSLFKTEVDVRKIIKHIDTDKDGMVSVDEYFNVLYNSREGFASDAPEKKFVNLADKTATIIEVKGHSGVHSYAQEEMTAFAEHFNQVLGDEADLKSIFPIDTSGLELCSKVRNGLLLSRFINLAVADTIDERALNKPKKGKVMSLFQISENQNLCLNAAQSIGVVTVNIGAQDLIDGEEHPHLVLGLVWQLVRLQLLNSITIKNHPELIRLLDDDEDLTALLSLPPEQLLLRWLNFHLKNAGYTKKVSNFSSDLKDSLAYTHLLNQIAPDTCDTSALNESSSLARAGKVLENAGKLNVHAFIKAKDISNGNHRLNLAFTAAIFNQCPGLDAISQEEKEEIEKAGLLDDDVGDSREERAFRMWINSLGVEDLYLNGLFGGDLKDGLALLRIIDHIQPGTVCWRKVTLKCRNKFSAVINCNYAVTLGKSLKLSLVGIGGSDIYDGHRQMILAFVWQLMRLHTLKFLALVQAQKFGNKPVTDSMIVEWANAKVQGANLPWVQQPAVMTSFRDSSLKSGLFFLEVGPGSGHACRLHVLYTDAYLFYCILFSSILVSQLFDFVNLLLDASASMRTYCR